MNLLNILSCLMFGCLLIGCTSPTTSKEDAFATKLAIASSISVPSDRDRALSQLALDAANANRPKIAKKSIRNISAPETKCETASKVAIRLAGVGANEAAFEIARTILSNEVRNETLEQIINSSRNSSETN